MGRTSFDWRWLFLAVVVLLFFGGINLNLSPIVGVLVLGGCAWWMIQAGLRPWRGRLIQGGGRKETYWRGQRIVIEQPRRARWGNWRTPPAIALASSIFYLCLGATLGFAAVRLALQLV